MGSLVKAALCFVGILALASWLSERNGGTPLRSQQTQQSAAATERTSPARSRTADARRTREPEPEEAAADAEDMGLALNKLAAICRAAVKTQRELLRARMNGLQTGR